MEQEERCGDQTGFVYKLNLFTKISLTELDSLRAFPEIHDTLSFFHSFLLVCLL